jgi:hypothetical protein
VIRTIAWGVIAAAGCARHGDDKGPALLDTGWFTTGDLPDPENCDNKVVTTVPETGETGVYWRDRPAVFTATPDQAAYTAWLQKATGERIPTTMVWDDGAGLSFTLEWDGWLEANTDYVLGYQDCAAVHEVPFRTSEFGRPLSIDPGELAQRTYQLDLVGATWVEPGGLGGVLSLFFTTPILLGVKYADDTKIDLLGAPGVVDELGVVRQDPFAPTWDFPMADFTQAPYLDVSVSSIVLQYQAGAAYDVPIEDFVLQGTFSADGNRLGGGVLSGLGDTRNLGPLVNDPDNPSAICYLAETVGASCVPCRDAQPYCLYVVAIDLEGVGLSGVTLVESGG